MRWITIVLSLFLLGQVRAVTLSDDFEGGSLGCVGSEVMRGDTLCYTIQSRFDPRDPLDTLAHRNNRWFYFRLTGVRDRLISIGVDSTDVQRPLYSYDNSHFERFSEEEMPQLNGRFTKRYERDTAYIAYYTPYSATRNEQQCERWSSSENVAQFTLGTTASGRAIPALIITDRVHLGLIPNQEGAIKPTAADLEKRVIYIHGRIHPSESPSSWHLEALIDKIIEDETGALANTIFYVVPIINPDGVALGRSRTNRRGVNMEYNYNRQADETEPEVAAVKGLIEELKRTGLEPSMLLNMHSQSTPKVAYWVHSAASTSPQHHRRSSLFAALTTAGNTHFTWRDVSHSHLKPYFLEGWVYRFLRGRAIALTYETPYSFYRRNSAAEWVNGENLTRQAEHLYSAIIDMMGVGVRDRIFVSEPVKAQGFKRFKDVDYLYFGGSALAARTAGLTLTYCADSVEAGDYRLFRWVVGRNSSAKGYETGCWEFVRVVSHRGGTLCFELDSAYAGELFDGVLLCAAE